MASKALQNRLGIELALECLEENGFSNVQANKNQGTYPHAYILGIRSGIRYMIGVTSRQEIGRNGLHNHSYNIVKTAKDMEEAKRLAGLLNCVPAFVSIALNSSDGTYSAFFGKLASIQFARSIPMEPGKRLGYEKLAVRRHDNRVAELR